MRKLTVLLLFLIFSVAAHAQQHTLLKILNGELRKEVKNQLKSPQFNGDTIRIVRPFEISKDIFCHWKSKNEVHTWRAFGL